MTRHRLARRILRDAAGARGRVRRRGDRAIHRGAGPGDAADPRVALGASPRGILALLKLARARAALARRTFVTPDDVKDMAVPALAHRIILRPELWVSKVSPVQVVEDLLSRVPTPKAEPRMTWRTTRAGLSTLTLLSLALALGVVSRARRAVPRERAARSCACSRSRGARRAPPVTRSRTSCRPLDSSKASRLTVTVTLAAETRLPQVEVFEPLPPSAELTSGRPRRVLAVPPGDTERWSYDLHLPERGRYVLGTVYLRAWEPSGLGVLEAVLNAPETSTSIRAPRRSDACRRRSGPRPRPGNYVSPLVGDGIEPGEIRPFAPGDRIKHVNWRASLRREPALRDALPAGAQRGRRADARHAEPGRDGVRHERWTRASEPPPRSPPPISRARTASA